MKYLLLIWLFGIHAALALPESESIQESDVSDITQPEDDLYEEIEPALTEKYFGKKPSQFLVDPQAFILGKDRKSVENLLKNHAADSTIDLYLFVFGEDQKLPIDGISTGFVERHFSKGKPAVFVYYYFGDPSRTEMYLSPSIAKAVSPSEQQRSVQSSLIRAMREKGSFDQLEEFLIQFSVRTYWMERMLDDFSTESAEVTAEDEEPVVQVEKKKANLFELIPDQFKEPVIIGLGCLGAMVVLWGLMTWLRSRTRFKFPELEVEARLGGSHAAGIGAVVNFASPAVSPARQREQVPEYMRRA
jgi:hypothetical protein